ncbi:unnamed protein product [Heterosigma akashiwo]
MMLEMQNALKGKQPPPQGYQPVSTSEYIDFSEPDFHIPTFNPHEVSKPLRPYGRREPHPGFKVCFIFSVFGIFFLLSIAFLMSLDSPYLIVVGNEGESKPELAKSVYGAASIYALTLCISLYFWCRGTFCAPNPTLDLKKG